jgi:hypothetical protein
MSLQVTCLVGHNLLLSAFRRCERVKTQRRWLMLQCNLEHLVNPAHWDYFKVSFNIVWNLG